MEYMGDSKWWNERFKSRKLNVMSHEKSLQDDLEYFPESGKILDIACGDGRNAVYLARLGYEVVAVDFSQEALDRLNYFAKQDNLRIETKLIDLSNKYDLDDKFEAVIINHYRLNPQLYVVLMERIKKDGVLWVNGFSEVPDDNPNITEVDILKENDFEGLHSYILEDKCMYEINKRKFIRCIWRK